MDVTVLSVDGCPNRQPAEEHLRAALARAGRDDVAITRRQVASMEEARQLAFLGSPTILVDGRDPFADPDAPAGLACRVYATPEGLSGAPTVEQLVEVLR